MTNIQLEEKILAFASEAKNPHLKFIKFILVDDLPNINKHVIPQEEFAALAASAIGMPIKMRFLGRRAGAGDHSGSIPIGHVQTVEEETLEDGSHRLIADGVLYASEFPEQIEYLEEAFEEGKAPGISWEINYTEGLLQAGIMALKGLVAKAATFVKNPAYGTRTALLALASDASLTEEEIQQEVAAILKDAEPEGGTENVTLEEAQAEITRLSTLVESKDTEIATLTEAAKRVPELEASVAEKDTAIAERDEAIASYNKATLIADRTNKAVEAGLELDSDPDKLAETQELWASMSEEVFNHLVNAVKSVAPKTPKKEALASIKLPSTPAFPKFDVPTQGAGTPTVDLVSRMRSLGRSE
jgi:hypothetical protein